MLRTPLICLLFSLSLLFGCDPADDAPARGQGERVVKVITEPVSLEPLVDRIQALGSARANESIFIRPRIASLVTRIAFDEGQYVEAGDLLVELENSEILAGLELAKASLSESRSLYERSRSLASTQAISASNLEQLLAQVKVNEAQVQAASARLKNTRITAPFSGRVGLRQVSPGSFVDTSTVITTLDDVATIKLDFSVPETFLTVLSIGMNISAHSIVYPGADFDGEVVSIDTRVDQTSRAVLVRALVDNADARLKPGMFMTVDLERQRGKQLIAPEQSIVPEGSEQYVFVVSGGVAEKRAVTLGQRLPGRVVVESGLNAGEIIVTEGTQKVRDGSRVESIDPTALGQSETPFF